MELCCNCIVLYQIVYKIYRIVHNFILRKNPRSVTNGNTCRRDLEVPQTTQGKHVDSLPQLYMNQSWKNEFLH
jgi:hypothetical protein